MAYISLAACNGGGGGSSPPPAPAPPPSGGWAVTGSLNTARDSHTATVLTLGPPTGRVLVAGGTNGVSIFTSAELYDPVAGTWSFTASMTVPRQKHTATPLPNGTVLATGGLTTATNATATAELFNPVTGTWAPTGSMNTPRALHIATLLPDGTVLVAGGVSLNGGVSLATAEIYDPATGVWTATGAMAAPRLAFTGTLLPDGRVLAAGGTNLGNAQAELYDPATGTWTATGNLITARTFQGAALLPTGMVLVAGGAQFGVTLASAELYDPLTGVWSATASMSTSRSGVTAVLLPNGTVLMAGGLSGNTAVASAEAYAPATGMWTAAGSMGTARTSHTTTLLPTGQVLAAGGVGSDTLRLASAVLFTPTLPGSAGTWTATGSMNTPRSFHTATQVTLGPNAGKMLVAGGADSGTTVTASAELYDPALGTWISSGSMMEGRQAHTAAALVSGPNAGKILVAGGLIPDPFGALDSAELYDPITGTWSSTGAMNNPRGSHAAVLLTSGPNAGKILVAGGLGIPVAGGLLQTNTAELYDPVSGTWADTGAMVTARYSFTLTMLPTGKVLAAGGPTDAAELYDPVLGTWSTTGGLSAARVAHSGALLTYGPSGGKTLVAGGQDSLSLLFSSELYDPIAGSWAASGNFQQARYAFSITSLPNGQALAAGGALSTTTTTAAAELFNPRTGLWSLTGSLGNSRGEHAAILLPQGQVLVSGGQVAGAPSVVSELYSSSIP